VSLNRNENIPYIGVTLSLILILFSEGVKKSALWLSLRGRRATRGGRGNPNSLQNIGLLRFARNNILFLAHAQAVIFNFFTPSQSWGVFLPPTPYREPYITPVLSVHSW